MKERKQKMYQIDAFSGTVFGGNPAAVCVLEDWWTDELMQSIASENNLSETAFVSLTILHCYKRFLSDELGLHVVNQINLVCTRHKMRLACCRYHLIGRWPGLCQLRDRCLGPSLGWHFLWAIR